MMYEMIAVGQWYLREDTQERFQVLDYDERAGTVRMQMFDGSLDEIDEEAWRALSPEPVEPPEDWTGPLDNVEIEEPDPFETSVSAGSEDSGESWESLLLDDVQVDVQVPEELDEGWKNVLWTARDHSRTNVAARSRA